MDPFDDLADALDAPAPARAEKILSFLLRELRTQKAALLAFAGVGDLVIVAQKGQVPVEALQKLKEIWRQNASLRAGRPYTGEEQFVAPVSDRGGVIGLLYVSGRVRIDDDTLDVLRPKLVEIIQGAVYADALYAESFIASIPTEELERIQLAAALRHQNGNISGIARVLRKTRRTIYRQIRKFGLRLPDKPGRRRRVRPSEAT